MLVCPIIIEPLKMFKNGRIFFEQLRICPNQKPAPSIALNLFLPVCSGGRIDQAHHAGRASMALHEALAFDHAIAKGLELTKEHETLTVVMADHSQPLTFNGYPFRGQSILGNSCNSLIEKCFALTHRDFVSVPLSYTVAFSHFPLSPPLSPLLHASITPSRCVYPLCQQTPAAAFCACCVCSCVRVCVCVRVRCLLLPVSSQLQCASATSSLTFHLLSLSAITGRVNTYYWQPFCCLSFYFSHLRSPSSAFFLPISTLMIASRLHFSSKFSSISLSPVILPLKSFPY